jgi:transcription initiation factor IIE alpha subunit
MSAYDHLKAKGIDLIQNDSLRRNITAVYSERYYYIERQELEYDNAYQMNEVIPQLNAKVVLDDSSKTGYPINLAALQRDDAFKGTLRMNVKVRKSMIKRYTSLSVDLKNLIAHIDSELDNRKL